MGPSVLQTLKTVRTATKCHLQGETTFCLKISKPISKTPLSKMQSYAKCKIMQDAKLCKMQNYARCKIMQSAKQCKEQNHAQDCHHVSPRGRNNFLSQNIQANIRDLMHGAKLCKVIYDIKCKIMHNAKLCKGLHCVTYREKQLSV